MARQRFKNRIEWLDGIFSKELLLQVYAEEILGDVLFWSMDDDCWHVSSDLAEVIQQDYEEVGDMEAEEYVKHPREVNMLTKCYQWPGVITAWSKKHPEEHYTHHVLIHFSEDVSDDEFEFDSTQEDFYENLRKTQGMWRAARRAVANLGWFKFLQIGKETIEGEELRDCMDIYLDGGTSVPV